MNTNLTVLSRGAARHVILEVSEEITRTWHRARVIPDSITAGQWKHALGRTRSAAHAVLVELAGGEQAAAAGALTLLVNEPDGNWLRTVWVLYWRDEEMPS